MAVRAGHVLESCGLTPRDIAILTAYWRVGTISGAADSLGCRRDTVARRVGSTEGRAFIEDLKNKHVAQVVQLSAIQQSVTEVKASRAHTRYRR